MNNLEDLIQNPDYVREAYGPQVQNFLLPDSIPPAAEVESVVAGGTTLDIGSISDGEFVKRSGSSLVGGTPTVGPNILNYLNL